MERLRLLTINIWNRQGPWERRLELIREGIAALSPDLVALQEVLHHDGAGADQADDIARDLGYHVAFGPSFEIGHGLHFGNAVLSRFPIVEQKVWPLPQGGHLGADEGRSLLYVAVDAPCGYIPFFVTHLNWRLHQGAIRQQQVQFIVERVLESATPTRFPPILAGDFNAEPESDEIRFLRGHHAIDGKTVYFADVFHCAGDGGAGHTYARRNPFALQAHEPSRRLDYLFVRGPDRQLRGEPLVARVVLDQADIDGVYPSDHFGVYGEISAAARPLGT